MISISDHLIWKAGLRAFLNKVKRWDIPDDYEGRERELWCDGWDYGEFAEKPVEKEK